MASFDLFALSNSNQTLASGEFGFIADTGILDVEGTAILANGVALVTVMGSLSGSSIGLDQAGGALRLVVGDTGRVASDERAVDALVDGGAFLSNHGSITAGEFAVIIGGLGPITIRNSGSITAKSFGIFAGSEDGLTRIVNNGTIRAPEGRAIELVSDFGSSLLINRGVIKGGGNGVFAGFAGVDGFDEVRNSGTIRGGVSVGDSADIITNGGFIDFAALGPGDDIVFNKGAFEGGVDLGDGIDVYVGRRKGSAGFVDGGAGEDTLVGSRANDIFIGGPDADVFEFAPRGGDDRIFDFGDGDDEIDLTLFGFSSFRDVRGQIEDRKRGALIDLSDDGQTIFLEDVEKADLGRSDFLLEL